MTKARNKVEIQTLLIHLTSDEDRRELINIFNSAYEWLNERGDTAMSLKAATLRDYVKDEVSEPVGKVLPTER